MLVSLPVVFLKEVFWVLFLLFFVSVICANQRSLLVFYSLMLLSFLSVSPSIRSAGDFKWWTNTLPQWWQVNKLTLYFIETTFVFFRKRKIQILINLQC